MPTLLEPNSTLSKRRSAVMEILRTKPEIRHSSSRGILNKDRRSEILSFLSYPIVRSYMSLLRKRASKSEDGGLGNNKSYIGDTISFALPEKETRGISEVDQLYNFPSKIVDETGIRRSEQEDKNETKGKVTSFMDVGITPNIEFNEIFWKGISSNKSKNDAVLLAISRLGDMVNQMSNKVDTTRVAVAPPAPALVTLTNPGLDTSSVLVQPEFRASPALQLSALREQAMLAASLGKIEGAVTALARKLDDSQYGLVNGGYGGGIYRGNIGWGGVTGDSHLYAMDIKSQARLEGSIQSLADQIAELSRKLDSRSNNDISDVGRDRELAATNIALGTRLEGMATAVTKLAEEFQNMKLRQRVQEIANHMHGGTDNLGGYNLGAVQLPVQLPVLAAGALANAFSSTSGLNGVSNSVQQGLHGLYSGLLSSGLIKKEKTGQIKYTNDIPKSAIIGSGVLNPGLGNLLLAAKMASISPVKKSLSYSVPLHPEIIEEQYKPKNNYIEIFSDKRNHIHNIPPKYVISPRTKHMTPTVTVNFFRRAKSKNHKEDPKSSLADEKVVQLYKSKQFLGAGMKSQFHADKYFPDKNFIQRLNKSRSYTDDVKTLTTAQLTKKLQSLAEEMPSQGDIASGVAAGIAAGILSGGNNLIDAAKANGLFEAVAKGFNKMTAENIAAINEAAEQGKTGVSQALNGKNALQSIDSNLAESQSADRVDPAFLIGKAAADAAKEAKDGSPHEIAKIAAEAALNAAGVLSGRPSIFSYPKPIVHEFKLQPLQAPDTSVVSSDILPQENVLPLEVPNYSHNMVSEFPSEHHGIFSEIPTDHHDMQLANMFASPRLLGNEALSDNHRDNYYDLHHGNHHFPRKNSNFITEETPIAEVSPANAVMRAEISPVPEPKFTLDGTQNPDLPEIWGFDNRGTSKAISLSHDKSYSPQVSQLSSVLRNPLEEVSQPTVNGLPLSHNIAGPTTKVFDLNVAVEANSMASTPKGEQVFDITVAPHADGSLLPLPVNQIDLTQNKHHVVTASSRSYDSDQDIHPDEHIDEHPGQDNQGLPPRDEGHQHENPSSENTPNNGPRDASSDSPQENNNNEQQQNRQESEFDAHAPLDSGNMNDRGHWEPPVTLIHDLPHGMHQFPGRFEPGNNLHHFRDKFGPAEQEEERDDRELDRNDRWHDTDGYKEQIDIHNPTQNMEEDWKKRDVNNKPAPKTHDSMYKKDENFGNVRNYDQLRSDFLKKVKNDNTKENLQKNVEKIDKYSDRYYKIYDGYDEKLSKSILAENQKEDDFIKDELKLIQRSNDPEKLPGLKVERIAKMKPTERYHKQLISQERNANPTLRSRTKMDISKSEYQLSQKHQQHQPQEHLQQHQQHRDSQPLNQRKIQQKEPLVRHSPTALYAKHVHLESQLSDLKRMPSVENQKNQERVISNNMMGPYDPNDDEIDSNEESPYMEREFIKNDGKAHDVFEQANKSPKNIDGTSFKRNLGRKSKIKMKRHKIPAIEKQLQMKKDKVKTFFHKLPAGMHNMKGRFHDTEPLHHFDDDKAEEEIDAEERRLEEEDEERNEDREKEFGDHEDEDDDPEVEKGDENYDREYDEHHPEDHHAEEHHPEEHHPVEHHPVEHHDYHEPSPEYEDSHHHEPPPPRHHEHTPHEHPPHAHHHSEPYVDHYGTHHPPEEHSQRHEDFKASPDSHEEAPYDFGGDQSVDPYNEPYNSFERDIESANNDLHDYSEDKDMSDHHEHAENHENREYDHHREDDRHYKNSEYHNSRENVHHGIDEQGHLGHHEHSEHNYNDRDKEERYHNDRQHEDHHTNNGQEQMEDYYHHNEHMEDSRTRKGLSKSKEEITDHQIYLNHRHRSNYFDKNGKLENYRERDSYPHERKIESFDNNEQESGRHYHETDGRYDGSQIREKHVDESIHYQKKENFEPNNRIDRGRSYHERSDKPSGHEKYDYYKKDNLNPNEYSRHSHENTYKAGDNAQADLERTVQQQRNRFEHENYPSDIQLSTRKANGLPLTKRSNRVRRSVKINDNDNYKKFGFNGDGPTSKLKPNITKTLKNFQKVSNDTKKLGKSNKAKSKQQIFKKSQNSSEISTVEEVKLDNDRIKAFSFQPHMYSFKGGYYDKEHMHHFPGEEIEEEESHKKKKHHKGHSREHSHPHPWNMAQDEHMKSMEDRKNHEKMMTKERQRYKDEEEGHNQELEDIEWGYHPEDRNKYDTRDTPQENQEDGGVHFHKFKPDPVHKDQYNPRDKDHSEPEGPRIEEFLGDDYSDEHEKGNDREFDDHDDHGKEEDEYDDHKHHDDDDEEDDNDQEHYHKHDEDDEDDDNDRDDYEKDYHDHDEEKEKHRDHAGDSREFDEEDHKPNDDDRSLHSGLMEPIGASLGGQEIQPLQQTAPHVQENKGSNTHWRPSESLSPPQQGIEQNVPNFPMPGERSEAGLGPQPYHSGVKKDEDFGNDRYHNEDRHDHRHHSEPHSYEDHEHHHHEEPHPFEDHSQRPFKPTQGEHLHALHPNSHFMMGGPPGDHPSYHEEFNGGLHQKKDTLPKAKQLRSKREEIPTNSNELNYLDINHFEKNDVKKYYDDDSDRYNDESNRKNIDDTLRRDKPLVKEMFHKLPAGMHSFGGGFKELENNQEKPDEDTVSDERHLEEERKQDEERDVEAREKPQLGNYDNNDNYHSNRNDNNNFNSDNNDHYHGNHNDNNFSGDSSYHDINSRNNYHRNKNKYTRHKDTERNYPEQRKVRHNGRSDEYESRNKQSRNQKMNGKFVRKTRQREEWLEQNREGERKERFNDDVDEKEREFRQENEREIQREDSLLHNAMKVLQGDNTFKEQMKFGVEEQPLDHFHNHDDPPPDDVKIYHPREGNSKTEDTHSDDYDRSTTARESYINHPYNQYDNNRDKDQKFSRKAYRYFPSQRVDSEKYFYDPQQNYQRDDQHIRNNEDNRRDNHENSYEDKKDVLSNNHGSVSRFSEKETERVSQREMQDYYFKPKEYAEEPGRRNLYDAKTNHNRDQQPIPETQARNNYQNIRHADMKDEITDASKNLYSNVQGNNNWDNNFRRSEAIVAENEHQPVSQDKGQLNNKYVAVQDESESSSQVQGSKRADLESVPNTTPTKRANSLYKPGEKPSRKKNIKKVSERGASNNKLYVRAQQMKYFNGKHIKRDNVPVTKYSAKYTKAKLPVPLSNRKYYPIRRNFTNTLETDSVLPYKRLLPRNVKKSKKMKTQRKARKRASNQPNHYKVFGFIDDHFVKPTESYGPASIKDSISRKYENTGLTLTHNGDNENILNEHLQSFTRFTKDLPFGVKSNSKGNTKSFVGEIPQNEGNPFHRYIENLSRLGDAAKPTIERLMQAYDNRLKNAVKLSSSASLNEEKINKLKHALKLLTPDAVKRTLTEKEFNFVKRFIETQKPLNEKWGKYFGEQSIADEGKQQNEPSKVIDANLESADQKNYLENLARRTLKETFMTSLIKSLSGYINKAGLHKRDDWGIDILKYKPYDDGYNNIALNSFTGDEYYTQNPEANQLLKMIQKTQHFANMKPANKKLKSQFEVNNLQEVLQEMANQKIENKTLNFYKNLTRIAEQPKTMSFAGTKVLTNITADSDKKEKESKKGDSRLKNFNGTKSNQTNFISKSNKNSTKFNFQNYKAQHFTDDGASREADDSETRPLKWNSEVVSGKLNKTKSFDSNKLHSSSDQDIEVNSSKPEKVSDTSSSGLMEKNKPYEQDKMMENTMKERTAGLDNNEDLAENIEKIKKYLATLVAKTEGRPTQEPAKQQIVTPTIAYDDKDAIIATLLAKLRATEAVEKVASDHQKPAVPPLTDNSDEGVSQILGISYKLGDSAISKSVNDFDPTYMHGYNDFGSEIGSPFHFSNIASTKKLTTNPLTLTPNIILANQADAMNTNLLSDNPAHMSVASMLPDSPARVTSTSAMAGNLPHAPVDDAISDKASHLTSGNSLPPSHAQITTTKILPAKITSTGSLIVPIPQENQHIHTPKAKTNNQKGPNPYEILTSDMLYPGNYGANCRSKESCILDFQNLRPKEDEIYQGIVNYMKSKIEQREKQIEAMKRHLQSRKLPVVFKVNNEDGEEVEITPEKRLYFQSLRTDGYDPSIQLGALVDDPAIGKSKDDVLAFFAGLQQQYGLQQVDDDRVADEETSNNSRANSVTKNKVSDIEQVKEPKKVNNIISEFPASIQEGQKYFPENEKEYGSVTLDYASDYPRHDENPYIAPMRPTHITSARRIFEGNLESDAYSGDVPNEIKNSDVIENRFVDAVLKQQENASGSKRSGDDVTLHPRPDPTMKVISDIAPLVDMIQKKVSQAIKRSNPTHDSSRFKKVSPAKVTGLVTGSANMGKSNAELSNPNVNIKSSYVEYLQPKTVYQPPNMLNYELEMIPSFRSGEGKYDFAVAVPPNADIVKSENESPKIEDTEIGETDNGQQGANENETKSGSDNESENENQDYSSGEEQKENEENFDDNGDEHDDEEFEDHGDSNEDNADENDGDDNFEYDTENREINKAKKDEGKKAGKFEYFDKEESDGENLKNLAQAIQVKENQLVKEELDGENKEDNNGSGDNDDTDKRDDMYFFIDTQSAATFPNSMMHLVTEKKNDKRDKKSLKRNNVKKNNIEANEEIDANKGGDDELYEKFRGTRLGRSILSVSPGKELNKEAEPLEETNGIKRQIGLKGFEEVKKKLPLHFTRINNIENRISKIEKDNGDNDVVERDHDENGDDDIFDNNDDDDEENDNDDGFDENENDKENAENEESEVHEPDSNQSETNQHEPDSNQSENNPHEPDSNQSENNQHEPESNKSEKEEDIDEDRSEEDDNEEHIDEEEIGKAAVSQYENLNTPVTNNAEVHNNPSGVKLNELADDETVIESLPAANDNPLSKATITDRQPFSKDRLPEVPQLRPNQDLKPSVPDDEFVITRTSLANGFLNNNDISRTDLSQLPKEPPNSNVFPYTGISHVMSVNGVPTQMDPVYPYYQRNNFQGSMFFKENPGLKFFQDFPKIGEEISNDLLSPESQSDERETEDLMGKNEITIDNNISLDKSDKISDAKTLLLPFQIKAKLSEFTNDKKPSKPSVLLELPPFGKLESINKTIQRNKTEKLEIMKEGDQVPSINNTKVASTATKIQTDNKSKGAPVVTSPVISPYEILTSSQKVDPSLRRTPDSGQLLRASNSTSTNGERQQQTSKNNSSVVPSVVPYDPAHGLSPYEVLTSEQIKNRRFHKKCVKNFTQCKRHHIKLYGKRNFTSELIRKKCGPANCTRRTTGSAELLTSSQFDADAGWLGDGEQRHYGAVVENTEVARAPFPMYDSHHSEPYQGDTHAGHDGDHNEHFGEHGDHGGDHETDSYGNEMRYHGHALVVGTHGLSSRDATHHEDSEHHEEVGHHPESSEHHEEIRHYPESEYYPCSSEPTVIANADPQRIAQLGSYQEPGLGGHGPYRGPTSHYHCHEPHDDPVPVLIRPPPPIHGQNPYEVLTSSQFHPHDSYHHEAKVQFQLQDPHSYGKHYGPVYDVRHPEHAGRPAEHLDEEHEEREHGHYRSQAKKKNHHKQKNKANTNSVFDLINHKDAVKRLRKIDGPSNQKNVSTLEKVKKVKSKQKARLNRKSKNKLSIKENIRLTDAKPLNNTVVPNMLNKTFMNPFPNHYNHHTHGILGHIVPATLNQENKTFPSNTNTHLMGMAEQDNHTPEARLIAPPVNNTLKHHQHQNHYPPDEGLNQHEEYEEYSPQGTSMEHPVSERLNHHGEKEGYIPDERMTAHPENGTLNGEGENEDYSDEEREAEAAVNEKIGDYEGGCDANRKDCIKKKSKNKINNIYKKFNSDLKISETIVDHMEHQVINNFSKLGNQGQQNLNNSVVEFVGKDKNHTSLELKNVGNKELNGKNETSRKVKLNKNFQLMKEAKTEASKLKDHPRTAFITDMSQNIVDGQQQNIIKHFLKDITETLLDEKKDHFIGIASFGTSLNVDSTFSKNLKNVKNAIDSMKYQGKEALVGEAIKQARGKLLTEMSGIRNQVVFILAGQPADDAKQLFKEAMKLKKEGFEVYCIGLGESFKKSTSAMKVIASLSIHDHTLKTSYRSLKLTVPLVLKKLKGLGESLHKGKFQSTSLIKRDKLIHSKEINTRSNINKHGYKKSKKAIIKTGTKGVGESFHKENSQRTSLNKPEKAIHNRQKNIRSNINNHEYQQPNIVITQTGNKKTIFSTSNVKTFNKIYNKYAQKSTNRISPARFFVANKDKVMQNYHPKLPQQIQNTSPHLNYYRQQQNPYDYYSQWARNYAANKQNIPRYNYNVPPVVSAYYMNMYNQPNNMFYYQNNYPKYSLKSERIK